MADTKKETKTYKPLGIKKVYFDKKNGLNELEVVREKKDGTLICYDLETEDVTPIPREQYGKIVWGTRQEAIDCAVERLQKYVDECSAEIALFKSMK